MCKLVYLFTTLTIEHTHSQEDLTRLEFGTTAMISMSSPWQKQLPYNGCRGATQVHVHVQMQMTTGQKPAQSENGCTRCLPSGSMHPHSSHLVAPIAGHTAARTPMAATWLHLVTSDGWHAHPSRPPGCTREHQAAATKCKQQVFKTPFARSPQQSSAAHPQVPPLRSTRCARGRRVAAPECVRHQST